MYDYAKKRNISRRAEWWHTLGDRFTHRLLYFHPFQCCGVKIFQQECTVVLRVLLCYKDIWNIRNLIAEISKIVSFLQCDFIYCKTVVKESPLFQTMIEVCQTLCNFHTHSDVTKWKHLPRYWPFVRAGNSPVTCEFPSQRPVPRSFDIFFLICAWMSIVLAWNILLHSEWTFIHCYFKWFA